MDEFAKRRRHCGRSLNPPWTAARAVVEEDGQPSVGLTAVPAGCRSFAGRLSTRACLDAAEGRAVYSLDFRETVDRELCRILARGEPTIESVAQALAMCPKALARRLAQEGTTFRAALSDLRRRLALRYVGGTELSVDQIAMLLGYGSGPAFRQAFRRWTGASPSVARQARLATTA